MREIYITWVVERMLGCHSPQASHASACLDGRRTSGLCSGLSLQGNFDREQAWKTQLVPLSGADKLSYRSVQ